MSAPDHGRWRDAYRDRPFKPLGYYGPHIIPEFGWRAWLRGAPDAYRGARTMMGRKAALVWVWRARP